jgi:Putative zinc ribbon domain
MPSQEPLGPFCQSCAMPMEKMEDFGTDRNGCRINAYCRHCYQNDAFTDPDITLEQMINRCVEIMAQQKIMPAEQARSLMTTVIPGLQRWRAK